MLIQQLENCCSRLFLSHCCLFVRELLFLCECYPFLSIHAKSPPFEQAIPSMLPPLPPSSFSLPVFQPLFRLINLAKSFPPTLHPQACHSFLSAAFYVMPIVCGSITVTSLSVFYKVQVFHRWYLRATFVLRQSFQMVPREINNIEPQDQEVIALNFFPTLMTSGPQSGADGSSAPC